MPYSPETIQQLRDIPLEDLLERNLSQERGYWRGEGVFLSIQEKKYFNHYNGSGGNGAINLVMDLLELDFKGAVEYLLNYSNLPSPLPTTKVKPSKTKSKKPSKTSKFNPREDKTNWPEIRDWLIRSRKLDEQLVDSLHKQGLISSDNYGNALFVLRNFAKQQTGFALKRAKFNHLKKEENGWFYFGPKTKHIYLFEAPIDAISLFQKIGRNCNQGTYLATCGTTQPPDLSSYQQIHISYDCDPSGELAAWKIANQYPDKTLLRHIPLIGKDFNHDLTLQRSLHNYWWKKQTKFSLEWSKMFNQTSEEKLITIQNNLTIIKKIIYDLTSSGNS